MPEFVKSYEITHDGHPHLLIDGEELPWFLATEGPLVEAYEGNTAAPVHILWLPVMVDAPLPTPPEGHPDGESLVDGIAGA